MLPTHLRFSSSEYREIPESSENIEMSVVCCRGSEGYNCVLNVTFEVTAVTIIYRSPIR